MSSSNTFSSISFHRRYHAYSGGHQKVRDYLQHTLAFNKLKPYLWCESLSDHHPKLFTDIEGVTYQSQYQPNAADIVFLAGLDWEKYLPKLDKKRPKINLIQHIRHGDSSHPLHRFLKHKAIRICVSEAVRQAILPYANGPCITIKMGYALPQLTSSNRQDMYILATKQPELGKQIFEWAIHNNYSVTLHDKPVDREQVHMAMSQSKISIVLPNKTEGFFLPGIEAMALSQYAVVPDCIVSREYCLPMSNAIRCELSFSSCVDAILLAEHRAQSWLSKLHKWRGSKIANNYRLENERQHFHQILDNINSIW